MNTKRQPDGTSGITDIMDRTQGHLILKWNAWSGADKLRKIGLSALYCIIALVFLMLFAIESFLQNKAFYAEVLLGFAILTVCCFVYLLLTGNRRTTNAFIVLLLGMLCLFLLYTGGRENTGPLWFYVFPIFALFAQRLWSGVISVIILLIMAMYILYSPSPGIESQQYSAVFKERFLAVYAAVSIMSFLYAFLRASAEMELTNVNDHLRKRAEVDELTGLPNRRRMKANFYQEISRFRRSGKNFSILMVDIDNFKRINDTHGHANGDFVLQTVAETIKKTLRTQDVCARWGGEEFVILLPETKANSALIIAERLRKAVQDTVVDYDDVKISITISIGIREFHSHDDLSSSLKEADKKLYEAKGAGKNMVVGESPQ